MQIIEKTIKNLKKNNMDAYYCENAEAVRLLVKTLLKKGDVVSNGGSESLKECGILDILKNGDYQYLDRAVPGYTRDQVEAVYRKVYSADCYFASSNAITEEGVLYNVDGNSNRMSAVLYGPKSVVLVCGYNKIVKNLEQAIQRVKEVAAPMNTARLRPGAYCETTGACVSLKKESPCMSDGCSGDGRICCNYVISAQQRHKGRIKIIIAGEKLGY